MKKFSTNCMRKDLKLAQHFAGINNNNKQTKVNAYV